ncbi:hypothetical protein F4804DRAFT_352986 [Jackrogersella minutella]|nr:hypothetical protein F4804DRAFT_352986 [Jackrogersella minutella]
MSNTNNQHAGAGSGNGGTPSSHQKTNPVSMPSVLQYTNNSNAPSAPQRETQAALPQYFIVRPNVTKHTASGTVTKPGPIVPLVAVDQLPEWLDLAGVPRELSVEQTVGLSNLGTVVRSPEFYTVYMHSDVQPIPAAAMGSSTADARDAHLIRAGQGQRQTRQQQRRAGDGNNGLLIPVDVPGPSSSTSSTASTPPPPSHMDPAAKSFSGDAGKKPGGSSANKSTLQPTAKADRPQPAPSPKPAALGLLPRLPSPTATGSTPPAAANPYPMLHPYLPGPHAPSYAPPPSAYALPPPSTMHPAERLLYSYAPHARAKAASSTTSTATSKPANPAAAPINSVYCKHWCHRGTCRWGAQCRYAHLMPATAEGLREVGLSHHPAWWTTAFSMAYGAGGGGGWYPPPPPPRHYGVGGKKAQKGKEKKEKAVEGDGGKGTVAESSGGGGGGGGGSRPESKKVVAVEGKAAAQEQRKLEKPREEQKLVEI